MAGILQDKELEIVTSELTKIKKISCDSAVYSRSMIDYKISMLKSVLRNEELYYSVKANDFSGVIMAVAKKNVGFSVSSDYELRQVLNVVPHERKVVGVGLAFSTSGIHRLLKLGGFDFSNISQLKIYLKIYGGKICSDKIGIRISDESQGKNSRFGFSKADIAELSALCRKYNFRVSRLHIHYGEKTMVTLDKELDQIKKVLQNPICQSVKKINLGGGWDLLDDEGKLSAACQKISRELHNYKIEVEPGSVIIRKSGFLKSSVYNVFNDSEKIRHVVLSASQFNFSSWFIPKVIAIIGKQLEKSEETVIEGNTCVENDVFEKGVMSVPDVGSSVVLYPVGAYFVTTHRELHGSSFPRQRMI
jgi:diaminopimelate decarboxylase